MNKSNSTDLPDNDNGEGFVPVPKEEITLTPKETRRVIWNAVLAGALVFGVFAVIFGVVIWLLTLAA